MNVVGSPYTFKIIIVSSEAVSSTKESENNFPNREMKFKDNRLSSNSRSKKKFKKQSMPNILPNCSRLNEGIFFPVPTVTYLDQRDKRPDTPPIDLTYQSDILKKKNIRATDKKIGFLGLGKIGQGALKNLCHSGHSITIWNETPLECQDFAEKFNIHIANSPADVISAADITFSCLSDADIVKRIVCASFDIYKQEEHQNGERKDFVQMVSMDPKGSEVIGYEIKTRGGRYLEAPLIGSRIEANEGTLLVLAAGDKLLYDDCNSCFNAMSEIQLFISNEVGTAFQMSLIHNMLVGTMYASVAEALTLVKQFGLNGGTFLDILKHGAINSQINICEKGLAMIGKEYVCNTPLKQTQKDISLGLSLGEELSLSTPIFAAANQVYIRCKSMGYGDYDVSAVFEY